MTNSEVGTQVSQPEVAETYADTGPIEGNKAASAFGAKPKAKDPVRSGGPSRRESEAQAEKPDEILPCLRPKTDLYLCTGGPFCCA